ncbi:hypothetical protein SG0102_20190 [Intestinibaculum porci]|uniref:TniQ domain-containing protein n=1 Tax=Intestinibaculum porci TaxID=2487118 RepID=A0A3G9JFE7_9FIRM|nr:TniQ family protein [Intestinibaculum porci]BBH27085.1 hypothetical protein SG0102_20190 [Intestinibaculum porci]
MIMTFISPVEDETFYSFMSRLAEANGTNYQHLSKYLDVAGSYDLIKHETMTILNKIEFPLPADEILMKHTLFPLIAPLFNDITQTMWINGFERKRHKFPKMIPLIRNHYNGTNICPICLKEDLTTYNRPLFRRSHQAPGVTACWKHGVKLVAYGTEDMHVTRASDFELNFANFCHELLKTDLHCNFQDITFYLREIIETKFVNKKDCISLIEHTIPDGMLTGPAEKILNRVIFKSSTGTTAPLNILLFEFVLSTVSNIRNRFESEKCHLNVSKDYEVLKSYGLFSVVQHNCGERFLATEYGFNAGWQCPHCENARNDEEKFIEVAENVNPDYKICSEYLGPQKFIEVKHKCGLIHHIRAKYMLEERVCECEKGPTLSEMKSLVEQNDFKLLSAEKTTSRSTTVLKIKHTKCGHIFFKTMSNFQRSPYCSYCRSIGFSVAILDLTINNTDEYKKAVADLTGDDYTVLTGISTSGQENVKIRCNKCKKIIVMPARDFLVGRRCPCEKNPYGDEFPEFVLEASKNLYHVRSKEAKNSFDVFNSDGKVVLENVSKLLILSELRRPTQSKVLPLPDDVRKKVKDVPIGILPYIRNTIAENPSADYTAESLSNENYSIYDLNMKLSFLQRRGELYRVSEGVYHDVNDPDFDKKRIMPEKTFEIRDLLWILVKDRNDSYTISELSDLTGYSVSQIGTALVSLDHLKRIHRVAMGTYVTGAGKDFVTVPDQVLEYVKENLSEGEFTASDINIPDLTRQQITDALKKFPQKGLAKRIKTGVYMYTGKDRIREKTMEDTVMDVINKDIVRDYTLKDFEFLDKPKNQLSSILSRLVRKGYLYRVSKGVFHSTEDVKEE